MLRGMFESRLLTTRIWALCLVFAFVVLSAGATTVPDSRGAWTKAAVPIELRGRVHASAREVPAFPDEDPKLMHLKNWPKKREIEGWNCELKVPTPRKQVPPGFHTTTTAFYLCHPRWWPWGKPEMRGPDYIWASDGHLLERAYRRSRNDVLIYQVDRLGRLAGYHDRKRGTEEYFDADGVLIGGEYAPVNLDWRSEGYRGGTVSVWQGERVSHGEFIGRLSRFVERRY